MPSVSTSQQHLMGAAEHGARFPMARKVRASMTAQQLHDFASGPETGKPDHVSRKDAITAKVRDIYARKAGR